MEQTRVKAGHMLCARDKRRSNISKSIFFLWVIHAFAEFYKTYFCVHCLFSSQENNSKQSVAHK